MMEYTPCELAFIHRFANTVAGTTIFLITDDSLESTSSTLLDILPTTVRKDIEKRFKKKSKAFYIDFPTDAIPKTGRVGIAYLPDTESISETLARMLDRIEGSIMLVLPDSVRTDIGFVQTAVDTLVLSSYHYQRFVTKKQSRKVSFFTGNISRAAVSNIRDRVRLYESIYLARDLVNTPPSRKTPSILAEAVLAMKWKHTKVRVIDAAELTTLGCELIMAVGAGSNNKPIMMLFERIDETPIVSVTPRKTLACIGKGVTFDAGGIMIKPERAMLNMKADMAGAASVIATMQYLDSIPHLAHDIIGAVTFAENMTGGEAFKPLDILRAYNGVTVENHHTDAEWRLILGDTMAYVEKHYHPDSLLTIATLTGTCRYMLWYNYAGIMGDDESMIRHFQTHIGAEKFWRIPFDSSMCEALKGDNSDIRNINDKVLIGASIGGAFLSYFKGKAKFTHIDIAGPAFRDSPMGIFPKYASWFGVMTLSEILSERVDVATEGKRRRGRPRKIPKTESQV